MRDPWDAFSFPAPVLKPCPWGESGFNWKYQVVVGRVNVCVDDSNRKLKIFKCMFIFKKMCILFFFIFYGVMSVKNAYLKAHCTLGLCCMRTPQGARQDVCPHRAQCGHRAQGPSLGLLWAEPLAILWQSLFFSCFLKHRQ